MPLSQQWESKVQSARARRDDSLALVQPALTGLPAELPDNSRSLPKAVLTAKELEITEQYTVEELLAKLRSRELSAEEVTRAFLRRAAVAQYGVSRHIEAPADVKLMRSRQTA
jgi:sulfur carrier protein ThiS